LPYEYNTIPSYTNTSRAHEMTRVLQVQVMLMCIRWNFSTRQAERESALGCTSPISSHLVARAGKPETEAKRSPFSLSLESAKPRRFVESAIYSAPPTLSPTSSIKPATPHQQAPCPRTKPLLCLPASLSLSPACTDLDADPSIPFLLAPSSQPALY
jgi:hypothetical protein